MLCTSQLSEPIRRGLASRFGVLDVLLACVAKCLSVQVKYKEGARKVQRSVRLSDTPLDGAGQPAVWRGQMTASVGERVLKLLHEMSEVSSADRQTRRSRLGSQRAGRPLPPATLVTLV